jgi:hypothetical protein
MRHDVRPLCGSKALIPRFTSIGEPPIILGLARDGVEAGELALRFVSHRPAFRRGDCLRFFRPLDPLEIIHPALSDRGMRGGGE